MHTTKKLLATVCLFCALHQAAFAQGTAFTYQGQLSDGGAAANGSYDLRFAIYDAVTTGTQQGGFITNSATAVSNGLFTVTLDFGNQFPGAARWLEIGVRTNNAVSFFTLNPRQALAPAPYAITAGNVVGGGLAAGIYGNAVTFSNGANSFIGTFNGNGGALSNVNAGTLGGLASSNFWNLAGNFAANPANGIFIGTIDMLPLELRVGKVRALRLEPNTNGAPNVIGGSPANVVDAGVIGAVIAGGGATNEFGFAHTNEVSSNFGFIGGGTDNLIETNSTGAIVLGGENNTVASGSAMSTIAGGEGNSVQTNTTDSSILGGFFNVLQGGTSVIGGGAANTISNSYDSAVGTGFGNRINSQTAGFVGGGYLNSVVGPLQGSGGGIDTNRFNGIVNGFGNQILLGAGGSFVGGGASNVIAGNSIGAVIGGGLYNTNSGFASTVPGGELDAANGDLSFAAGFRAKANHPGTFVWADSQNADFASTSHDQFLIRATGGVGIGTANPVFPLTVGVADTPLTSTAQIGAFNSGNAFVVTRQTAANVELQVGVDNLEGVVSVVSDHPLVFRAGNGSGTGNHEYMRINTNGFVGIGTSNPTNKLQVVTAYCTGTSWVNNSDRNLKENFENLNAIGVLEKIVAMPIGSWSYKSQPGERHIGPMAQDFHAAFALGDSDRSISTVDEGGVALAAIQGLNEKIDAGRAKDQVRIRNLEEENLQLKQRLDALEQLVRSRASD